MPNTIKYNASTEANALRVGNFHIGVRDVSKGPTSITGFYNGINPPSSGYTIYQNKASQGPSIICPSDDAQLIIATNRIAGASYTTINECFDYFAGQSDKFVMFNPINTLDTNDLTLYLNAAPLPSYPRSGDTCYDLSTDSNNAGFYNGATFDSNSETMDFDGVNDYILTENNVTITGDQSIETTIKFDTLEGFLQGLVSNHDYVNTSNFGINQVQTNKIGISIGYTNGSREYQDKYSTTAVVTGRFYHIVMTFNLSANQCKLYIDGELDSTFNLTKTVKYTSRPMVLGRWDYQYTNYYFDGEISQAKYYSKTLSAEEVSLNYYQGQIITDGLILAIDASNLVSYENGATTTYSLTGSLSGTLSNGTGYSSDNGGVFTFDGNNDRIDNFTEDIELATISIEYWKKWTTLSDDWLIGNQTSSPTDNNHGWYHRIDSPSFNFFTRFGVGTTSRTVTYNPVVLNEWTHVVSTFDSVEGVKLYWNGVLVGTNTNGGTLSYSNVLGLEIGGANDGSRDTPGPVGPVRIYDRVLTATEVQQNYNANINRFN